MDQRTQMRPLVAVLGETGWASLFNRDVACFCHISAAFTAYICNTRDGSTGCNADKALLRMDI